jgi:hypothetical protein
VTEEDFFSLFNKYFIVEVLPTIPTIHPDFRHLPVSIMKAIPRDI